MSEAVKRFNLWKRFGEPELRESADGQLVLAADHDRIVSSLTEAGRKLQAERDAWRNACKALQIEEEKVAAMDGELTALRAEVERLRKDAELFRRLRDLPDELLGAPGVPCVAVPEGPRVGRYVSGPDLDDALEASRCS
ncbi:hypothetical protein ACFSKY_22410 [Azotobacter chroococcum]|uniref:Uncharacterized protein n=1 Tax=Azotobacter chroococcum TaxID=353 RepID=A0A4R1NZC2_9GAMM|nr:hypothetical protein [Azotobacter chroococcum]TBV93953.1 hypothetical protein E0E53_15835 [Azotobacter chroococcum]TCL18582.1 hypothetical protein EV691_1468 [Azotobacter chroococcum]